jgi:hypothetical protein
VDRLSKLLLAVAATAAVPIPALAQARPATVEAAGPQMAQRMPAQALARLERDPRLLRRPGTPPTEPLVRLKLSAADTDEIPAVEIQPKDEWLDDQGLRVGPTKVAFKRRF